MSLVWFSKSLENFENLIELTSLFGRIFKIPTKENLDFDSMFRFLKNLLVLPPITQVRALRTGDFSLLRRFFSSANKCFFNDFAPKQENGSCVTLKMVIFS